LFLQSRWQIIVSVCDTRHLLLSVLHLHTSARCLLLQLPWQAEEGETLHVKQLTVKNDGWQLVKLSKEERDGGAPETLRMRGYKLERSAQAKASGAKVIDRY
jgi:hypothetical protein